MGQTESGTGEYSYAKYASEGYAQNPVLFSVIRNIGLAASAVRWYVGREDAGGDIEELPDHPLAQTILRRPNPYQAWAQWVIAYLGYKLLAGNSYMLKVGPDAGPPQELWFLEPHKVELEFSNVPAAPIRWFVYESGRGTKRKYDPMDVLHIKEWHPTRSPYDVGLPRLAAAAWSVDANNRARQWNSNLLANAARPTGILTVEGKMSPTMREDLRAEIELKISGYKNAGRPPIVEAGMQWQAISFSPAEMEWLDGVKVTSREICNVFNFPPELLGDPDLTTYSNRKDARKSLYTECVMPELDFLRDELNAWLVPMFGDRRVRLYYDDDSIDALSEDREKVWQRVKASEELTLDEKREALGYEALGDLDGGALVLVSSSKVSLEDVLSAPESVQLPTTPAPPIQDEDDDQDAEQ